MRKKINVLLTALLLSAMTFSANVFAQSGSGQVRVNLGCVYSIGVQGVTRTGAYSYVDVKADSVYSDSGSDNFTRCRTKLTANDRTKTVISDEYVLTEGQGYTHVYIYEGYQNTYELNILFAGNDPLKGAVVDFSYDSH